MKKGKIMIAKISNEWVEVSAVAGKYGFIITSVKDLKNQKEWIYAEEQSERSIEKTFDEQYQGGVEFLFPGDEEEIFEEKLYKDHGELWRMPYTVWIGTDELVAEGRNQNFGISVKVSIRLDENHIQIMLETENKTRREIPYLLRLHPAFVFGEDTRLVLNEEKRMFEEDAAYCTFTLNDEVYRNLNIEEPYTYGFHEVFLHILQKNGEFLVREKDRSFIAEYDNQKLPYLTLCSFMKGNKRLGILEPANVPGASLTSASKRQTVPELKPGEKINCNFKITLK